MAVAEADCDPEDEELDDDDGDGFAAGGGADLAFLRFTFAVSSETFFCCISTSRFSSSQAQSFSSLARIRSSAESISSGVDPRACMTAGTATSVSIKLAPYSCTISSDAERGAVRSLSSRFESGDSSLTPEMEFVDSSG